VKPLSILVLLVLAAFLLLLVVGFENVLELFRSRVTLFLLLGPLVALFFWCAYKAFWPKKEPNVRRMGIKDKG
jgi:hypothetical protein